MENKSPYKTPEEALKASEKMWEEHHRKMETDPEYRKEIEMGMERWEKILYPDEYNKKHQENR